MNTKLITNIDLLRLGNDLDAQIWIAYNTGDDRDKAKVTELINRRNSVLAVYATRTENLRRLRNRI